MAIRVYSDKSGDEDSDGVITVGGYMADADLCESIESEWEEATDNKVFHLTDFGTPFCKLGSGNWPIATRNDFLKKLAGIVNREGVTIFSGSMDISCFDEAIGKTENPGEIGPAFSACAYGNMAYTEYRILVNGWIEEKARYVFEKGDREHEITNVFRDIEKNDDSRYGLRGFGFEPKEITLLQPADLIAGTVQRCMVRARKAIPLLDNGLGWIKLNAFDRYYDSAGVTLAVLHGHDGDGCRIYASKFITSLDKVSSIVLGYVPQSVQVKRRRRYSYKPRKKSK